MLKADEEPCDCDRCWAERRANGGWCYHDTIERPSKKPVKRHMLHVECASAELAQAMIAGAQAVAHMNKLRSAVTLLDRGDCWVVDVTIESSDADPMDTFEGALDELVSEYGC